MKAKEYLESIRSGWSVENAIKRQIQFEEASLMGGGIDYSKPSVKHSAKDQMAERVPEIVELMNKLEEIQRINAHRRAKGIEMVAKLKEEQASAIVYYYFQNMTQEEAAYTLGITRPTLCERMRKGIEELDERYCIE